MSRFYTALRYASVPMFAAGVMAFRSQGSRQSSPVFRAGTDYVSVDVVVTDHGDRPIKDLTQADFDVRENGKPQTVTDFRFVDIPVSHRHLDLENHPAPSDVATNAPVSPDSRLFVLIVDDLHLVEATIPAVQKVMTEFVSTLSTEDDVAILFTGHSDLSQNFTNEPSKLLKAIKNVRAAFGFGIGVGSELQVEELPYDRDVAWQLKNVADCLANSTHVRRAIVFVGAFSQLNPAAEQGTVERAQAETLRWFVNDVWDAARRADVPIYTIDPRGVPGMWNSVSSVVHPMSKNADVALNVTAPQSLRAATASAERRTQIQQDHLAEMALNTGGRAFINRSDLVDAVDELMAENGSFYELGYYPNPAVHDGKFHQIGVSVRRPDTRVRAKPGYLAPASETAPPASVTQDLDGVLGQALNVSGLSLRAVATPLAATAKGMETAVTVEVTYPKPRDGAASIDDDLKMSVLGLDPDGKVLASSTRTWHIKGLAGEPGNVTLLVDDLVDLRAQPLTLRIGAASKVTGKAGTVQLSLDIPKPLNGKLQLGGVAIGYAGPIREPAIGTDVIQPVVPFQPTTTRRFATTDVLRVYSQVFWESQDPRATITIDIANGRAPVAPPVNVIGVLEHGHRVGVLDTLVPLGDLEPGDHALDITATLPNHERSMRAVPFVIR